MKKASSKFIYLLLSFLAGIVIGGKVVSDVCEGLLKEKENAVYKFKGYFNILTIWFTKRIHGESIAEWLIQHHYKNIAIYGMGDLGKLLLYSLEGTSVKVKALMDINKDNIKEDFGLTMQGPEEMLSPEVDVVIVTVTLAFNAIKKTVSVKNTSIPILSLEDIIYDL